RLDSAPLERQEGARTDRTCAVNRDHLSGTHRTTIHRVPRDRERLDQRTLKRRDPRWKGMCHASLHHRVLGETAGTVVSLDRKRGTVVVLTEAAVQAAPAGLHRFHRNQSSDGEVFDTLPERYDLPAQLVTHDHGVLHTGERMRCAACGDRTVVVLEQVAAADPVVKNAQLHLRSEEHTSE